MFLYIFIFFMHKKRKRDTCIYGDHDALVNFQRDVFFPHLLPFFIARKHTQDKSTQRVWWFMQTIRHVTIERLRISMALCLSKSNKMKWIKKAHEKCFQQRCMICDVLSEFVILPFFVRDLSFLTAFLRAIFCSLLFLSTSIFFLYLVYLLFCVPLTFFFLFFIFCNNVTLTN